MEQYTFLISHGLEIDECDNLFTSGNSSNWCLQEKPKQGFYTDLLKYKHAYHPNVCAVKFGEILLAIDPWLKNSVSSPLAAYSKAAVLHGKRRQHDLDTPVAYKRLRQTQEV